MSGKNESNMMSVNTFSLDKQKEINYSINEEIIITIHRILENFGFSPELLNFIHSDLFDSRIKVVLSALQLLGKIKNKESASFIYRLVTSKDEDIQCAAVKTLGDIGFEESLTILIDLFKTTQNETVRNTILEALTRIAPKNSDVLSMILSYSISPLTGVNSRAFATGLLLEIGANANDNIDALIQEALTNREVMEQLILISEKKSDIREKLCNTLGKAIDRILPDLKMKLIDVASPFSTPVKMNILMNSLRDPNPEIRRAGYRVLGKDWNQLSCFEPVIDFLSQRVENEPSLEEEVRSAISRIENCLDKRGTKLKRQLGRMLVEKAEELFLHLKNTEGRKVSTSHELGWLIMHSKEYLEYYADEDLKQAVVQYLKGSGNYSTMELLKMVRDSAVKVEVRHFEGYKALIEIVKNPKRHGIALVARELALAGLGKRKTMYHIIRLLYMTRLFYLPEKANYFYQLFTWAKQQKLYRLAEAALYALARVDTEKTTSLCRECIKLPLHSKILAITTTHILKDLEWSVMEQGVMKLLEQTEEPYIILNLIDAISTMSIPFNSELRKLLLNRFILNNDLEIISRIGGLIGEKADTGVIDDLIRIFGKVDVGKKRHILFMMHRIVERKSVYGDLGLSEFLYKVLREQDERCNTLASVLLYKLKDDYAIKVLHNLFKSTGNEVKVEIIRELKGELRADFNPLLKEIIIEQNAQVQQTLRETILKVDDEDFRKKIVELVLNIRGWNFMEGENPGEEVACHVELSSHKTAYRFEKEYIVKTTVMFTDIVGYSRKAQELTSMELTRMINEYEGMLLSIMTSHHGELIKRMGDGHLFTFNEPLDAVLAGIRFQKSLKRYNSFREEKFKISVRVGIHWGDVVKKGSDIFGNTVNIASRLESRAESGSVYISEELNEKIKKYILSREIGPVQVKGIINPIQVFEPYEVSVDLPKEKDPLSRKQLNIEQNIDAHHNKQNNGLSMKEQMSQIHIQSPLPYTESDKMRESRVEINNKLLIYLRQTFLYINNLCIQAENDKITLQDLRKELVNRWHHLVRTIPTITRENSK